MGNVVDLPVLTTLDGNPDRVLEKAIGNLGAVIILGYDKDGEEFFASSYAGGPDVLWLLERTKAKLLAVADRTDIVR